MKKKVVESWYPELEEGLDAYEEPPEEEEEKEAVMNKTEKNQAEVTPKDKTDIMTEKMENADKG